MGKIYLKRFSYHQNLSKNFVAPKTSESFCVHPNRENPLFIWDFLGLKNLLKDFSGNPTNELRVFLILQNSL